jgi:uracil-DNA glycosylase
MSSRSGALPQGWPVTADWTAALAARFGEAEGRALETFLAAERKTATVYPEPEHVFAAFAETPLASVRVVVLGQDPYHGPGQAHGLSFSVREGCPLPPSLRNILAELKACGFSLTSGNLTPWARSGVLLLNTILTVRAGEPLSHAGKGWERLTGAALRLLVEDERPKVFLLWGNHARSFAPQVTRPHLVLEAAHPSPLSARRGFLGCRHFLRANEFLVEHGRGAVDWGRRDAGGMAG